MSKKLGTINLFWTIVIILAVGVSIVGGWAIWKLVYSTTPHIARSTVDSEEFLERTVTARQEENKKASTLLQEKQDVDSLQNDTNEKYDATYYRKDDMDAQIQTEDEGLSVNEDASDQMVTEEELIRILKEKSASAKTARPTAQPKKTVARKPKLKIKYATYAQGLAECRRENTFPCVWKDSSNKTLIKQYVLKNSRGPVERIIYTSDGKIISQTFSTLEGKVTRYQGSFAELYFENGLLTKIRTFPYDDPNLRDWFLIGKDGKISACLCGIPTKNCCARSSLYREGGPRSYCALFPIDTDFCVKSRS